MKKSSSLLLIITFVLSACSGLRASGLPANFPPQVFSDQSISKSGRILSVEAPFGNDDIWATNLDGTNVPLRLTDNAANDNYPAWSPDGLQIAFVSDRDNNPEIYVMSVDNIVETRLTHNAAADSFPAWSPDGKLIAFASNRDNTWEIYVMNADGTGQQRVTHDNAYDTSPSWSLDGQYLVYSSASNETAQGDIYIIKPDGSGRISYIDYAIPDKSVLKFDPNGKKKNCSAFKTQVEAQLFFIAAGGPLRDPHGLESGGVKGKACESLP